MKRRTFLKNSVTASALAALGTAGLTATTAEAAAGTGKRQYFELRVYRLKQGSNSSLLESYLEQAAIPALNRLGVKPIGVFKEQQPKEPAIFMVLPYDSIDAYTKAAANLTKDKAYLEAAAAYLHTAKTSPAYDRIDSWLLLAFEGMPRLQLAAHSRNKVPTRLFELRTYESYSEDKAAKKVAMFNDGEIQTMQEVGLSPVFYGQGLIGANLPHLTYMTSGESEEAHKKHWDAFGKHPKWDQMKNDPKYADTVSKMAKWMLVPTSYSQI